MRILATVVILCLLYWFLLRPVLLQWAALKPLYDRVDGLVLSNFQKLRLMFKGWKTILWSRFLMIGGSVLPLLQMTDTVDFSAILPALHLFGLEIPATIYATMVGVPLIGVITAKLRYATDGAVGQNTLLDHLAPAPTLADPAAVVPAAPAPVAPIATQVDAAIAQVAAAAPAPLTAIETQIDAAMTQAVQAADATKLALLADVKKAALAAGLIQPAPAPAA